MGAISLTARDLEVVRSVRQLLSDERRWTKGWWAKDWSGKDVPVQSKRACCWCLSGAVRRACADLNLDDTNDLINKFSLLIEHRTMGVHCSLPSFNDSPATTHADILAFLDEVLKGAQHASS